MLLTAIVFTPAAGALLITLFGHRGHVPRSAALTITTVELLMSAALIAVYAADPSGLRFVESQPWIRAFDMQYRLGVDGLSASSSSSPAS